MEPATRLVIALTWLSDSCRPRGDDWVANGSATSAPEAASGGTGGVGAAGYGDTFQRVVQFTYTSPITNQLLLEAGSSSYFSRWGWMEPPGAVTNLTAVMLGLRAYDPEAVQGAVLPSREVDRQIELYRSHSTEERRRIVGLQPKRAEVILAGACIVRTVMRKLRRDELTVSDRGLRHGLLLDRFGG